MTDVNRYEDANGYVEIRLPHGWVETTCHRSLFGTVIGWQAYYYVTSYVCGEYKRGSVWLGASKTEEEAIAMLNRWAAQDGVQLLKLAS